jgi:ankyrin repeat protein
MLVLSRVVLDGFHADNGNRRDPDANRSLLGRFDLDDELLPAERAFLFGTDTTRPQINDATWRSEALLALRWAVGDTGRLPVGGQASLLQTVPEFPPDAEVRAQLTGGADGPVRLRPEREVRLELERWFAVYWRMRLRLIGVERLNLAGWVEDNPYLTVLTPADLPLVDRDLSLDRFVMEVAREDRPAGSGGWRLVLPDDAGTDPADGEESDDWPVSDGRVPIRVCEPWMLESGENVLRVAGERLQALRWLIGATTTFGEDPTGHYEPDASAGFDKAVLYRDDRFSVRGGLPWCRAAWRGDTAALRSLLDAGVPTALPDIDGDLALHCAVQGGHREALALLLDTESPIGHLLEDAAGRTVLDLAAARGDLDLIDLGVAAGPNARLGTALLAAVRSGHAAAAVHLIRLGAPIDGALDAAVDTDRPDLVRTLAAHGATVDGFALYRAAGGGRFAAAAALVDLGADVHFADGSGTTVLHLAADRGATDLCLRLLEAGADLHVRLQTFGAVHFAVLGGHADTALALVERGADVTRSDPAPISLALTGG